MVEYVADASDVTDCHSQGTHDMVCQSSAYNSDTSGLRQSRVGTCSGSGLNQGHGKQVTPSLVSVQSPEMVICVVIDIGTLGANQLSCDDLVPPTLVPTYSKAKVTAEHMRRLNKNLNRLRTVSMTKKTGT